MPGRPPKPRATPNREKLLGKLRDDISHLQYATAREQAERAFGRKLTYHEWLAIQMTKGGENPPG